MNTKMHKPSPFKYNIFLKYIDKCHFERKGLPEVFINREKFIPNEQNGPKVSFNLTHNRANENVHSTIFDIEIDYTIHGMDSVNQTKQDYEVYTLKLIYIALTNIDNSQAISELELKQILLIDVPHLTFPHIERFVFDFLRDSGSAPLQIQPINWVELFEKEETNRQNSYNEN